jgi:hypothetical protein
VLAFIFLGVIFFAGGVATFLASSFLSLSSILEAISGATSGSFG